MELWDSQRIRSNTDSAYKPVRLTLSAYSWVTLLRAAGGPALQCSSECWSAGALSLKETTHGAPPRALGGYIHRSLGWTNHGSLGWTTTGPLDGPTMGPLDVPITGPLLIMDGSLGGYIHGFKWIKKMRKLNNIVTQYC